MRTALRLLCLPVFLQAVLFPYPAAAEEVRTCKAGDRELFYTRPGLWKTIADGPGDWWAFAKKSVAKESLPWLGAIGASTYILVRYDQKIYDNTRRFGKHMRISTRDKTRPYLKISGVPILRGPTDAGSAMYFLGDGWINIGLFGYFELSGWLKDDWRALKTGHQLMEGLLVTGFTTQVMKRITGRETPLAAHSPRGVWRPFVGFEEFQAHRTRYDAFPSGHLATGVMTVTVIAGNYPEKKLVKPVGYTLLGLLSFQMVNNGVHWISDYPLGIAVGYTIGKVITDRQRERVRGTAAAARPSLNLGLLPLPDGSVGPSLTYRF